MKQVLLFLLFTIFSLTSCMQAADTERLKKDTTNQSNGATGGTDGAGGDGATNTGGGIGGDNEISAKVEIRHLIEPKVESTGEGGDYKRKLTLPKNYNGHLYVAGINISSLNTHNLKVRFKFGLDALPIEVQATISTAPGLSSTSKVDVLVLDMRARPFNNIQLIYDLFDYNNYDFAGTGNDPGALAEPVLFNRDDKLFCRGLALKDDSTFTGSLEAGCSGSEDVCKFAYAKVVDKGLVEKSITADPNQPIVPNEPQIQREPAGLYDDVDSVKLQRCLPDAPFLGANVYAYNLTQSFLSFGSSQTIDGKDYLYEGPYRSLNTDQWQISSEAIKGQFGLFSGVFDDNLNNLVDTDELDFGYQSRLFPLYTKFDLLNSTEYLGANTADAEKLLLAMNSNSTSQWMDGCNERVTTVHDITGENVGSCNITATIEIVSVDDGKETIIDITDEVKLQLVKPALLDIDGENVLLSSFKQCGSSSQCGGDECCVNSHCWSKDIVKQCIEDLPSYGNQETGETCNSDFQCSSLCCNKIDGRCAPHDTISENPSFCSKPSGQSCVAKEWCQKHPITTCAIVSTGFDNVGGVTCALRCVSVEMFGECTSSDGITQGICVPPNQPDAPVFNPSDPLRCEGAITFEQLVSCANNPDQTCGF